MTTSAYASESTAYAPYSARGGTDTAERRGSGAGSSGITIGGNNLLGSDPATGFADSSMDQSSSSVDVRLLSAGEAGSSRSYQTDDDRQDRQDSEGSEDSEDSEGMDRRVNFGYDAPAAATENQRAGRVSAEAAITGNVASRSEDGKIYFQSQSQSQSCSLSWSR